MNEAEAFHSLLSIIRERRKAQEDVVMLTIKETFSPRSPSAMFERGRLTVFEELDEAATRIKIDCDHCSASGITVGEHRCQTCDGRGWNNPIEVGHV